MLYPRTLAILGLTASVLAQVASVDDVVSQIPDGQVQETAEPLGGTASASASATDSDLSTITLSSTITSAVSGAGEHETETEDIDTETEEFNTTKPDVKTSENLAALGWKAGSAGSLAALGAALLF